MRKLGVLTGCLLVLLFASAIPAFAHEGHGDDDHLPGSGETAPDNGDELAPAVEASAAQPTQTAGEDLLAATGLDTGATLLIGLGLAAAGGVTVVPSRKRARQ